MFLFNAVVLSVILLSAIVFRVILLVVSGVSANCHSPKCYGAAVIVEEADRTTARCDNWLKVEI